MKAKLKAMWLSARYDMAIFKVKVLSWKKNNPDEFWAAVALVSLFTLLCIL